jgi:hypothetical protein
MESRTKQWVVKAAGVVALALMTAAPSFAQSRSDRGSRRDTGRSEVQRRDNSTAPRTYRDNERVRVQGHVTSFSRERNGYRVQLDRGRESYWVPQSYFRNRGRGLSVGVQIILGGVFRGGSVYVDDVNWPDGAYDRNGYDNGYLAGTVERVDYRYGTAEVRDNRSGRIVRVDLRDSGRRGLDARDMRRGDYVELSGRWTGGVFQAYNIDAIRNR